MHSENLLTLFTITDLHKSVVQCHGYGKIYVDYKFHILNKCMHDNNMILNYFQTRTRTKYSHFAITVLSTDIKVCCPTLPAVQSGVIL